MPPWRVRVRISAGRRYVRHPILFVLTYFGPAQIRFPSLILFVLIYLPSLQIRTAPLSSIFLFLQNSGSWALRLRDWSFLLS